MLSIFNYPQNNNNMKYSTSKKVGIRLGALLYALLAWLLPQTILADNVENTQLYSVRMNGLDQLRIEMPVFDKAGDDGWCDKGYVYVTPEGGSQQTVLHYYSKHKSTTNPFVWLSKGVDGAMTLHRDQGWSDLTVTSTELNCQLPPVPGTDYYMLYIDWTVPASLRGKKLNITWSVHKTGNDDEENATPKINSTSVSFSAIPELVTPSLIDPMLGYDAAHAGKTMLIYTMATNDISSITAHYTEVNGKQETVRTQYLAPDMSGFIYLDADKCYKDFYLKAVYKDTEERSRISKSDPIVIPTLHMPAGLTAMLQDDKSVQLSWTCKNNDWSDIITNDNWDIQRNTTGTLNASAQWQSVGQVSFENSDTTYTFTDNSLVDNYEGKPVYYRVRRSSTAAWDWNEGTYAQTCLPFTIMLPTVIEANVSRGTWIEDRHIANFTFTLGTAQYDSEGRFLLRSVSDWETLATMVNSGTAVPDVIMTNDVDLGESQTRIGTESNPFKSNFDGNGHTLTIHYDDATNQYVAPFACVDKADASIKNLHVAGSITSTRKFAAGLVGHAVSTLTISNCRSSVMLNCELTGDATCGGLVGLHSSGTLTLTDCLFDGEFRGYAAHSFGGFVGWSYGSPSFNRCLFAPTFVNIDKSLTSSRNFARMSNEANGKLENCFFTTSIDGTESTVIGGKTYAIIRTTEDWNSFVKKVEEARGISQVNAILMNDISITQPCGKSNDIPFFGIFDGNGHTLSVYIRDATPDNVSPFYRVKDATIKNLNVKGKVYGGRHASGLVGRTTEGTTNYIENCHVSVDVTTTDRYAGGIIGHGSSAKNYIRYCLFDGTITNEVWNTVSFAGALMGWENGGTSNVVQNNLENGTYINFNHVGMNYNANENGKEWGGTNNWTMHQDNWKDVKYAGNVNSEELLSELGSENWQMAGSLLVPLQTNQNFGQGTNAIETSAETLANVLGGNWEIQGSAVVPIAQLSTSIEHAATLWDSQAQLVLNIDKSVGGEVRYTERRVLTEEERKSGKYELEVVTSCVDHDFRLVVEQGQSKLQPVDTLGIVVTKAETGEAARYEFDSNVQVDSLETTTQQASVALKWKTTGVGDFFRITRRDKATDEEVELESAYTINTYIDKTPRPQHIYTYTVEGVNDCEGLHISSVSADGWCQPTGMVRGYVRLKDGTAVGGVRVIAEPLSDTKAQGGETRTAMTDETGFFEIDSLIYSGQGSYLIMVESSGDAGQFTTFTAYFNEDSNLVTNAQLRMDEYYLLTGYVMYEDTSVPVIGAQFERDGEVVHNGSGQPIVTDSQGKFSISIPKGQHDIRVVKDGHVFADNGFYLDPDSKDPQKPNWQKSVDGYVFWDKTQVVLQGRVVGGDVQGLKPLGQLASVNNLGDSLTIVMQLEGDNASWLVRDQQNAGITERHNDYNFGTNEKDSCHMDIYRHRLVIKPNPETGEYCVPMLPVKYKVTEIYAEGYSTLFQTGKVGETLDLSDYVQGDTAIYSRIYHSMPSLSVSQFNMMGESYMGIKNYTDMDNTGKQVTIELWNDSTGYSLGHPVFMAGSPIIMLLSAVEKYYYNNKVSQAAPDVVHLPGGEVRIQNALIGVNEMETVKLDSLGEATYRFIPQNLTFTEENDLALKTLTMTLHYDGTFYDVLPQNGKPIQGYVMAAKAKSQGRRAMADAGTFLVDILRDPPGSTSSAYIESGTKLTYTFSQSIMAQAGLKLTFGTSSGDRNIWNGLWMGTGAGSVFGSNTMNVSAKDYFSLALVTTYFNSWQYGYTFETTERIQTSASPLNVGRDADLYIGMTQTAILEDGIAVRAINEDTYKLLTTHAGGSFNLDGIDYTVRQGTMKVLAEGQDSHGKKVYLVRDEVLSYRTELQSTFVHSQAYIENELIPTLFKTRNTLILPMGTNVDTAKKEAEKRGCPVYISLVGMDNDLFGNEGYYTQVNPDDNAYSDSLATLNRQILTWVDFLAINEREKLMANDLVKRYDVDGRGSVSYSETFGTSDSQSRSWQIPFLGSDLTGISFGPGLTATLGKGGKVSGDYSQGNMDNYGNVYQITFNLFGVGFYTELTPIVGLDYDYNYGKNESHTKKIGFTLAPSIWSNLVVDVYRTSLDKKEIQARVDSMKVHGYSKSEAEGLFFQYVTDDYIDYVKKGGHTGDYGVGGSLGGLCSYVDGSPTQYRSFVYRTRAGATNKPYEDERKTKYYSKGAVLDERTLEIDRLRIWTDQASVSNVPYDEPARFTIHMANESEVPDQATGLFTIMLSDIDNAKGAKITIDGNPLAGEGHTVALPVAQTVTKQVEVMPGADFDYDSLVIQLYDRDDITRVFSCNLSAHFVPTAGKVNISLPGDKWVVNTESQYDSERQQYYMPVRIDGFDVNYRNFDHIELQYKLSTQGDKEWVNVCSYYKSDSLMARATGVCQLIEDDGHIMATFWGEADPIEQQYDLRAVNYCRYGNGYLTRSSNILTGVKDTRRPQLFGSPKPEDGILGIGDDIILRFSEPIAGNYLRGLNNFQVLGKTNSSNISLSTCLRFNGNEMARTVGTRNLSDKSFTVDLMLNPDQTGKNMVFFSHGSGEQSLNLGISNDMRLMAIIGNNAYYSNEAISFNGLHQVEYVMEADADERLTTISFYDGTKSIGRAQHQGLYEGTGRYNLGGNNLYIKEDISNYEGEMLEFRLWNRALSVGEMSEYAQKPLTGYELGLMDNFPLNEGQGDYSYNTVVSGGDLLVKGTEWHVPDGIGMTLDGERGFRIDPQKFSRTDYQDYTMTFWFRTTDTNGTLLANGLAQTEPGAKDHFNFGLKAGTLNLRLGGCELSTTEVVNDGAWHYAALTVSRSRNVGNLYVDKLLKKTFAVDTLGGILGSYLAAGATYIDNNTVVNPLHGHIDEIGMYEMALPENIVISTSHVTKSGEELGLMAYLSFAQNETQQSNLQRLMPTGISRKRYRDDTTGEWTTQRDTLVAQADVERLASRTNFAPMNGGAQLENIRYSFVADGKDLLINLDVPDYAIEKTNVIITVKDVADLNGNLLASPVTMNLYVYRNPLRWNVKQITKQTRYGEEAIIEACIENLSGKSRQFSIEGLPVWITASQLSGTVDALGEVPITFTVSPYTNIGDYDEVIYVIGEGGMTEPLPLTLKVRGEVPDWTVDGNLLHTNISMSIIGQVEIQGSVAHDSEDMLAVFDENHRLMGVTHLKADAADVANDGLAYLSVYNTDYSQKRLFFEFFEASTGVIYQMMPKGLIYFKSDTILGTTTNPVFFTANNGRVQSVPLKKGWNWVSFNVQPQNKTVSELLNNATKWEVGDGLEAVKDDGSLSLLTYKAMANPYDRTKPIYSWDCADSIINIDPCKMYRFYSNSDKLGYFAGFSVEDYIIVKKGWNRIGYVSRLNQPLGTALAEYTDKASVGDIIKSQSEFAILTEDATGNRMWKGTLSYMHVGEGYMLKHIADDEILFYYPQYANVSRYSGRNEFSAPRFVNTSGTSMTVVAVAEGVQVEPGDRLCAYRGVEVCGIAEADEQGLFYLNVGDISTSTGQSLDFVLERDDEIIAITTQRQLSYKVNATLGTPDKPTTISFLSADQMEADGWYTLSGIKLSKRPQQHGIYIHDSKKVIIK